MKSICTLLFILSIICATDAQVITVDNFNPGADFTDLQMAIDSSDNGDTIYVAGSNTTYGNITINKSLVIFGNGYETTATSIGSQIGNLTFQNGSHLSHISGFDMNFAYLPSSQSSSTDSLILSDNKANYFQLQRGIGHVIEGNILKNAGTWCLALGTNYVTGCASTKINNNIVYGATLYSASITNLFSNNTFIKGSGATAGNFFGGNSNSSSAANLVNNIFFGIAQSDGYGCNNCTYSFSSFYYHDGTDYVGDNPLFVSPDTLAISNVNPYTIDHDINLQVGSPAIGAGQNGFYQGATGGATPFEYGGFAPIPRITSFTSTETTVEAGGTLQVTIQAVSKQ